MIKKLAFAALLTTLLTGPSLAAAEGSAVGVDPDAVARRGSSDRVLVVGADISVGDRVVTGASGRVQIVFQDQTRLVVGPGSSLEIQSYLLNGNRADKFAVNALAGTFRFISGNSPKSAYSINTPTASIAVRGTKFDITVQRGSTQVLLYEGGLQLCSGRQCVELTDRCDYGVADSSSSALVTWRDSARANLVRNFPLANIQRPLLQAFRVAGAQSCLTPPPPPSTDSLSSPSSGNPPSGNTTPPTSGGNFTTTTPTFGGNSNSGNVTSGNTTPTTTP